jgi:hypothetical protein
MSVRISVQNTPLQFKSILDHFVEMRTTQALPDTA